MIAIPRVRPHAALAELRSNAAVQDNCLSFRATALVWLTLSLASWGVLLSAARIVTG